MTTSEPTLAVVLCTYNGEDFLDRQLESIATQLRPPDCLVVRDDASTDSTLEILAKFRERVAFPVHVQVNAERLGYNANFATAMGDADADLIAFCDQDDVWYPEKLSVLCGMLSEDEGAGAACADARCVDGDGNALGYSVWNQMNFTPTEREQMRTTGDVSRLLRYNVISGHCMMIRARYRDLLLPVSSHGFYDYWVALVVQSVSHFAFADVALSDYRVHGSNAVGLSGSGFSLERRKHDRSERVRFGTDLLDRLKAISLVGPLPKAEMMIESWVTFCSFRAALPRNVAKRLMPVIRELRNGSYDRYAKRKSALYDLLLG